MGQVFRLPVPPATGSVILVALEPHTASPAHRQTAKSAPHPDLITATLATRVEPLPNIEY